MVEELRMVFPQAEMIFFLIKKVKIHHMFNVPANHTKSYLIMIRPKCILVCILVCVPDSKTEL